MQGKNWSNRVSIKLKLTKGNSYKIISIWLFQYWRTEKLIYIPIWLYSNGLSFRGYLETEKRLHSNMVIFKCLWKGANRLDTGVYIPIWLYSNGLFSVVLLCTTEVYIPIWLYSNAEEEKEKLQQERLHSNMVIFKSNACGVFHRALYRVYIPIWLYSNMLILTMEDILIKVYIPIWLYSNPRLLWLIYLFFMCLHSNMVIFK